MPGLVIRKLRALFSRRCIEHQVSEEIRFHLEMEARENRAKGMSAAEARRVALLDFGGIEQTKETVRDTYATIMMDSLMQDICYATRVLIKHRSFSIIAVFALTLGIGATTAVYSIVDGTVLRPLPFRDPDNLYSISVTREGKAFGVFREEYQGWIRQTRSFEAIITYGPISKKLTGAGEPDLLNGESVPAGFFEMLGVRPILGRTFLPEEDKPEATPVVVLGYGVWQRTFGGDPAVLGRFISLDNQPTMIVGVMPAGFGFPLPSQNMDIWAPVSQDQNVSQYGSRGLLRVYCRIKPGVSLEQAVMDLNRVCGDLGRQLPEYFAGRSAKLIPLHQAVTGAPGQLPLIIMAAVSLVLLIAIVNVANLTLGHASSRGKEIAVRLAIGASRWRVIRQLLTESLLLSLSGGAMGIFCAWMFIGSTKALLPENVPRVDEIGIDWRVAAFGACISVITGILSGLYPAWIASKGDLSRVLHQGAQPHLGRLRGRGARGALTVCEVTLALILCVGAGLLLKSFAAFMAVDIGIAPKNVVAFHLPLADDAWGLGPQHRLASDQRLIEAVSAVPGVTHVAVSTELPLTTKAAILDTTVFTDTSPSPSDKGYFANKWTVTPDYFQAMGSKLMQGRFFTEADRRINPQVVVVSEETAQAFWPGQNPLNKTLQSVESGGTRRVYNVVGVVKNVKKTDYQARSPLNEHMIYYPLSAESSLPPQNHFLIVRTANDPRPTLSQLTRAIWSVDKNQPVKGLFLMDDVVYRDLSAPRFRGFLLGAFATIALVIAVIGIYGIVSHSVAMRTHEMGVRMALGARRGDILQLVLGEGLMMVLIGIVIGVAAALALARLIEGYLYDVKPVDPFTFATIATAFVLVGLMACWIPAWRASKSDPLTVLRCE